MMLELLLQLPQLVFSPGIDRHRDHHAEHTALRSDRFAKGASEYIVKFFKEASDRMRWCCAAFENRYELGGERSIAVLFEENSSGEPEFLVQARAFDHGNEPEINTPAGIQFCPWCGANLKKWYGKHARELSRTTLRVEGRF